MPSSINPITRDCLSLAMEYVHGNTLFRSYTLTRNFTHHLTNHLTETHIPSHTPLLPWFTHFYSHGSPSYSLGSPIQAAIASACWR